MKKVISLFLSIVMLLSITAGLDFSAYASMYLASSGSCGANARYTFDGKILTISGSGAISDSAFKNANEKVYNAVIENGITSIGSYAFCGSGVRYVRIAESVKSVSAHAFGHNGSGEAIVVLNPDCRFASEAVDSYMSGTIYGYSNSTAQKYAQANSLEFESIDGYDCSSGKHIEKYNFGYYYYCVICQKLVRCQDDYHVFDDGVVTKSPSCTDTGLITYTCTVCGMNETGEIPATGHNWNGGMITTYPSCAATGVRTYTCTACGVTKTEAVAKKPHTYKTYTTKATTSKNGSVVTKCTVCGAVKSRTVINSIKSAWLSKTSYTYNGKVQTPSVTVKDSKGRTLKKNTDYTVTYAKGRKNVGKYAVKITFKGKHSGSKTLYYTIKPKATSISKLTAGKKKFTVKWKKQTSQTTGYQIQYSTSSKFKSAKTVTVSKNKTTSKSISKLKAKKKYYVRIRTYKTVGKTKYYSSWSKAKTVTTKK